MRNRRGFTLVEIMIVVAIIALLAAIAIPNLLRARLNANESAAIAAMQTLSTAAQSYRSANPGYPVNLFALSSDTPPYIDSVLGSGAKQGYSFTLAGATNSFNATASPVATGTTGSRSFYVDQSGVVRFSASSAAVATAGSPPIE
jgi:prepilin-type N-terminal cleavage/methylation domain-containing protein